MGNLVIRYKVIEDNTCPDGCCGGVRLQVLDGPLAGSVEEFDDTRPLTSCVGAVGAKLRGLGAHRRRAPPRRSRGPPPRSHPTHRSPQGPGRGRGVGSGRHPDALLGLDSDFAAYRNGAPSASPSRTASSVTPWRSRSPSRGSRTSSGPPLSSWRRSTAARSGAPDAPRRSGRLKGNGHDLHLPHREPARAPAPAGRRARATEPAGPAMWDHPTAAAERAKDRERIEKGLREIAAGKKLPNPTKAALRLTPKERLIEHSISRYLRAMGQRSAVGGRPTDSARRGTAAASSPAETRSTPAGPTASTTTPSTPNPATGTGGPSRGGRRTRRKRLRLTPPSLCSILYTAHPPPGKPPPFRPGVALTAPGPAYRPDHPQHRRPHRGAGLFLC